VARERSSCDGCTRGIVVRLMVAGQCKVLPVSSWGPQGGCWAKRSGVELTRAAAQRRGGGRCFGRWHSSAGIELRWPLAIEAQPYSVGAEAGR
jgi:hypothetical protein